MLKLRYLFPSLLLVLLLAGFSFAQVNPFDREENPFDTTKSRQQSDDPFDFDKTETGSSKGSDSLTQTQHPTQNNLNDEKVAKFRQSLYDFERRCKRKSEELEQLSPAEKLEWLERELMERSAIAMGAFEELIESGIQLDRNDERIRAIEAELFRLRSRMAEMVEERELAIHKLNSEISEGMKYQQLFQAQRDLTEKILIQSFGNGNDQEIQGALQVVIHAIQQGDLLESNQTFSEALLDAICRLTTSSNEETRKLAAYLVVNMDHRRKIETGFQTETAFWHSLESVDKTSFGTETLRGRMQYPVFLFRDSHTIGEIVKFIAEEVNAPLPNNAFIENLELIPIEVEIEDVPASQALSLVLDKEAFTYAIKNEALIVYPKDSDELDVSLNYEIRGLISESIKIDDVIQFLSDAMADDKPRSIIASSDSRLLVVGSELQQTQISELLAKLPRNY